MNKLFFILIFVGFLLPSGKVYSQAMKVPFTNTIPYTDGFLNEWEMNEWEMLTNNRDKFQVSHDNEFLYIAIEVQDSTLTYNSDILNSYDRDCIEIYISVDTAVNNSYRKGCWQIRFQRRAKERSGYVDGNSHRNTWSVAQLKASSNFVYGIQTKEKSWTLEVALPYSVLSDGMNFDKQFIRFAIRSVNNKSDKNDGIIEYGYWPDSTENLWYNPGDFAVIELVPEEVYTKSISLKENSPYAYISGHILNVKNVTEKIYLYDLSGHKCGLFLEGQKNLIDISNLKPGLYILRSKNFIQKIPIY